MGWPAKPKFLNIWTVSRVLVMHSHFESPDSKESPKNDVEMCSFFRRVANTGFRSLVNRRWASENPFGRASQFNSYYSLSLIRQHYIWGNWAPFKFTIHCVGARFCLLYITVNVVLYTPHAAASHLTNILYITVNVIYVHWLYVAVFHFINMPDVTACNNLALHTITMSSESNLYILMDAVSSS